MSSSPPIKVLHLIPSVSPLRGGPSEAVLNMVRTFNQNSDLGVIAEIATTTDHGSDMLEVPVHCLAEYQGAAVRFFPRLSPTLHSLREFAIAPSLTSWLWQNITEYDVLHVHALFSYVPTTSMAIARLRKVPYIARPIGQLCPWSLQQSAVRKKLYLSLIEKDNLNGSSVIHTTSALEQQYIHALGWSRSTILPLGVAIPSLISDAAQQLRERFRIADRVPILLFLGRFHPKKGLDILINALSQLRQYPFHLILAGGGSSNYEAQLHQWISDAQLDDRTYFPGFVSGDLKNLLLQGSDLFILTSHSENFGIALLESLAAGTPVLTTPGVGLSDMIQSHQTGYIPNLEVKAIAQQLEEILRQPSQLAERGQRARQTVETHYTWATITQKLSHLYHAIHTRQPIPHHL